MSNWEERLHSVRERELYMVLNYANISPNTKILEIGCGDGCQSSILRKYSNYVISTDMTTERGYSEQNALCDCERLPFKDNQFDIVYSSNVLEHVHDKSKALNEMKRVLGDDGTIIAMVPTATWRIISCFTYYLGIIPLLLKLIVRKIHPENKANYSEKKSTMKNENRPRTQYLCYIFPDVHGAYQNIFEETKSYLIRNWLKLSRKNGLEVVKVVKTLLYAPLELPLPIIDLSKLGICSTVAFILKVNKGESV